MKHYALLLLSTMIFSAAVVASTILAAAPEIVTQQWNKVEIIGQTKFSRFGIHIYDASLWKLSDPVREASDDNNSKLATALSIQYARNISAEKLLSNTHKQWKHLGITDQYPVDTWLTSLERIWPDVKEGDFLIFITSPEGSNRFYSREKLLGSIEDPRFTSAFLDIWLSPEAKYQKHRKELLGEI